MNNLGILKKPRPRQTVKILDEWIVQEQLAALLRRSGSEVRRWLERRDATRRRVAGGVLWRADEVLVDALEEWGYDVETT